MKRKIITLSGLLVLFLSIGLRAQEYREMMKNPNANFYDIQKSFNAYWEVRSKEIALEKIANPSTPESPKKYGEGELYQFRRWEWFMEPRCYPSGKLVNPSAKAFEAWEAEQKNTGAQQKVMSNNGFWNPAGITNYINGNSGYNGGVGRINCIAFDPNNVNTYYIGTPAGGIWRSTNAGTTWTSLSDGIPVIGVSGIVVNPANSNQIYILTGDGDGGHTGSMGVLVSNNGGSTWQRTGLVFDPTLFIRGYKLMMHPSNSSILFAITGNGIYRTSDAGVTWINVSSGYYYDCEFKPGDPNIMYASRSTSLYRSTNNGVSWTQITAGLTGGISSSSRVAVGVSAANANYVYLLCGGSGGYKGVYRSTDSGLNFTLRSNSPNILGYETDGSDAASQAGYDLNIGVDPVNAEIIYSSGIIVWKSTNGGTSWSCKTNWYEPVPVGFTYNHADQHAFEFQGSTIFTGSDGGVYKSTNGATTFTNLTSGLEITQIYRAAGTPADANLYLYGAQDNGCNKFQDNTNVNTHLYGADGMQCRINPSNSNIVYCEAQGGAMIKSTDGGANFIGVNPSSGAWVTPYIMESGNPNVIYFGGSNNIYKTTNAASSWTNVLANCGTQIAMAVGVNNPQVVYSATSSVLRKTTNGGTSWTNITGTLPVASAAITYIAVSTIDANKVWVSFSGYVAGEKVYYSANGGTSWTNVSGTLPNIPCNTIAFEPGSANNGIYVGTDNGVYYRNTTLGYWVPFRNGLPNVIVNDFVMVGTNKIAAATFGRGLWTSDLFVDCPVSFDLTPANNPGSGGYQRYAASDYVTSTRVYTAGFGTDVKYNAGNYVDLKDGFRFDASGDGNFVGYINGCPTPPAGTIALSGTFDNQINMMSAAGNFEEGALLKVKQDDNLVVQLMPNPFQYDTKVVFYLETDAIVTVTVSDLAGRVIDRFLNNERLNSGTRELIYNGSHLPNGVYFMNVSIDQQNFQKRIIKM